LAILQTKAESSNIDVPVGVLELIAHNVRNNIRELEGALNKVIAYSELMDEPITPQLVNMALADLIRSPEKVTIAQVIDVVCAHYNVSVEDIRSKGRSRMISFPRQVVMYLCRTETDASLPQIGSYLGNRDHTTILYGYEKISEQFDTDPNVRRDVLEIRAALYDATG
jgi:chromosomal replication initiator protein